MSVKLLSHMLNSSVVGYGGKKGFLKQKRSSLSKGDTCNTSSFEIYSHIGTHIDFPQHFYHNGQTFTDFDNNIWFIDGNDIQVIELNPESFLIQVEEIDKRNINYKAKMLLFKTGSKSYEKNIGLSKTCAAWMISEFKKLLFLGIDSVSISSYQHRSIGRIVHKMLLNPEHPIMLIEDMSLSHIDKHTKFKQIVIAPLLIDGDGAPCTVFGEVNDASNIL